MNVLLMFNCRECGFFWNECDKQSMLQADKECVCGKDQRMNVNVNVESWWL